MGILSALVSAACFGLSMICTRVGMRSRPRDDGHFISVLVNVLILGALLLVAGAPSWGPAGIAAFAGAGLLTTFVGRGLTMRAIRLIGPARGSAMIMAAPVVAAFVGAMVLNEGVGVQEAMGGVTVLAGLGLLVQSKIVVEPLVDRPSIPAVFIADVGVPEATVTAARNSRFYRLGYIYSGIATISFGVGFVVSKWGVTRIPSPIVGAFVGAVAALVLIGTRASVTRDVGRLIDDNVRSIPIFFVLSGILTTVGLLTRYWAFLSLEAWIVSLLSGTQALWTLFWSRVLLGSEEGISAQVVLAVGLVSLGVIILTLSRVGL